MRMGLKPLVVGLAALSLTACASMERTPYSVSEAALAEIPGMQGVRFFGDTSGSIFDSYARYNRQKLLRQGQITYLAISGGGPDGAYGAGLLKGLSESGQRPNFTIVSGVSTGALMAPFVFLGPSEDGTLSEIYTSGIAESLTHNVNLLNGILGNALVDSDTLGHLITRYVDQDLLERIAAEHRKGRRLLVATTNLDSQRSVIWDMGAIASSGSPEALSLFRQVLAASASIPGLFPPRLIKVESQGRAFEEMHVDGGTVHQVFVAPDDVLFGLRREERDIPRLQDLYVLVNDKLDPEFALTENNTLKIGVRSLATVFKHQASTDVLAAYAFARRHSTPFHLAYVTHEAPEGPPGTFDTASMRALYEAGEAAGRSSRPWSSTPVSNRSSSSGDVAAN